MKLTQKERATFEEALEYNFYKENPMVKADWVHPLQKDSKLFFVVVGTKRTKPKSYIFEIDLNEKSQVVGMNLATEHGLTHIQYPWVAGYTPTKEDWLSVGAIYMSKLPLFAESELSWIGMETIDIHPSREYSVQYTLRTIQAKERCAYKHHPCVVPGWEYPALPDGYTLAMVSIFNGNAHPNYIKKDLSQPCSTDVFATDKGTGVKIEIRYPWISGYESSEDEWMSIGFSVERRWDGVPINIDPIKGGWL